MNARDILALLRQGKPPEPEALRWFAEGLADSRVSDAQAGAFAMGLCRLELGAAGRVALTCAMRDSGRVLDWSHLGKPVLDKHSTGGVGDCVSLMLAPALAACGAAVPMISGRGLGHTGGTLDKLEAIPGLSTRLSEAQLGAVMRDVGCAIVGASADIAPADKRLYAVRDVTATVESLDLITASILSKKLAGGLDALVLDVKTGSGAFMKDLGAARSLARALVETATAAGCKTTALITDMNQPVVPALGNALEVAEICRLLTSGSADHPMGTLCAELGGALLQAGGLAEDAGAGAAQIRAVIADGRAVECFSAMIAGQGGPKAFLDNWARFLPEANVIREVTAPEAGWVAALDGEAMGLAVVQLGGGRQVESDPVDPAVGLSQVVRLGARVAKGDVLGVVHAARPDAADAAAAALRGAVTLAPAREDAAPPAALIKERIG